MQAISQGQELRWRKTDESNWLANCPNHESLCLFYGRIYTPRVGYDYSETNQLIANLKISPNSESWRMRYKQKAILAFADELSSFLRLYSHSSIALVPMPPSKTADHIEYDDRIDQAAKSVSRRLENIIYLPLLYRTRSVSKSSYQSSGGGRSADQIYKDFAIDEDLAAQCEINTWLMIVDDVLTSGAHFAAARRRLIEQFPDAVIMGLFWAKAQSDD